MIGLLDDQRRAQRLPIYLPVQVYGKRDGVPFSENTETINVSACGGLVPISADVVRAQKLILTNLQTDRGPDLPRSAPDSQRKRPGAGRLGISAIRTGILALFSFANRYRPVDAREIPTKLPLGIP